MDDHSVKDKIQRFTQLFFEDLPYSSMVAGARSKIEAALTQKAENIPLEELLEECASLEKLAALAGFSEEDVKGWRSTELVTDQKSIKKETGKQRRRIYGIAVLCALFLDEFFWAVYNAVCGNREFFATLFLSLIFAGGGLFLFRKFSRVEKEHGQEYYDTQSFEILRMMSDRYVKRFLNSIALLAAAVTIFTGSELFFYFFGNSKSAELAENISSNITMVQIPLFLLVKNLLCLKMVRGRIDLPEQSALRKSLKEMVLFSASYWLVIFVLLVIFKGKLHYPANALMAAGALFFLLVCLYNVTLRKKVTFQNLVFNKRRFAVIASVVILVCGTTLLRRDTYYTQPYINSVPVVAHNESRISYDDGTGVYQITMKEEDFKILHLTDIHLGGSLYSYRKDLKALEACFAEIEHTRPDLVIVTGDLCFPLGIMSMSFNNSSSVYQFAAFMRNTGIPWAFTYGNHDTESLASMDRESLNEVYKSLSFKTSGNLLYPYIQPDITGRNNQMIRVCNPDGSLNTALFLIDSNAYTGEGINVYDYIHDDQVEWYADQVGQLEAEAGKNVNSLIFFHIPLQQYRTAYELYEQGSDEVTYFFGENNEKMINKICCSDYPSSLFDRILELDSTTGVFCGHDHYNNMSLEYKGIRLTYGMSIDYLAMPGIEYDTEQRGAELITLHPDSSWDVVQIPLSSIVP